LVRFFVRRNLTDTPPTRDLISLFMNNISDINAKEYTAAAVTAAIEQKLVGASATDEEFRRKLEGPIYEENTGATRFILCALAEKDMTRESMVDLWKVKNNSQFTWTIEHIFPQGERIPDEWVTMMAGGDKEKAKELQQSHVHKLGNLTISGFNSQLGNQSFMKKRDRTDHAGRPIGYRNGLKLNEDLARASGWSVAQIDARTKKLVDQAMELFKLQQGGAARA
ncbi:MAG: HNH endonuclease family protein, partial [Desulfovibrio sp.]|nr:HNH endonuclease family protein [Desulfovibrio sp.]